MKASPHQCFSSLESRPLKKEYCSRNKGGYCEPKQMMMNIGNRLPISEIRKAKLYRGKIRIKTTV